MEFNWCMTKTAKELAFLRDLYVDPDWTRRFTELADKHLGFSDNESLLYVNAGTGNHVMEIGAKAGLDALVYATCEDEHLLAIARDKADATRSKVRFTDVEPEAASFESVIADASLVAPGELAGFVRNSASFGEVDSNFALFAVSSGSFGEVFSLLWEAMMEEDQADLSLAERLITGLPTVSAIEAVCGDAGLSKIETHLANEVFEFANGQEFIDAPLVNDFLMPMWFGELEEKQIERVRERLARLIDEEDGSLSFRFSVKAVLVSGRKE